MAFAKKFYLILPVPSLVAIANKEFVQKLTWILSNSLLVRLFYIMRRIDVCRIGFYTGNAIKKDHKRWFKSIATLVRVNKVNPIDISLQSRNSFFQRFSVSFLMRTKSALIEYNAWYVYCILQGLKSFCVCLLVRFEQNSKSTPEILLKMFQNVSFNLSYDVA